MPKTQFDIPHLDEKEIRRLAPQFKNLIRLNGVLYEDVGKCDPIRESFTWCEQQGQVFVTAGLDVSEKIPMLHAYGAPSLLKPSIGEIISQTPRALREAVVAFEFHVLQLNEYNEAQNRAFNEGYHSSFITLYTEPEIENEEVLLNEAPASLNDDESEIHHP